MTRAAYAYETEDLTAPCLGLIALQSDVLELKANPDKEQLDSTRVAEIQKAHLKNIDRLAAMGKIAMAGPMGDDGNLRGIYIMDCINLEEAVSLCETDPAIVKKRLLYEIHPWWAAKGSVLP